MNPMAALRRWRSTLEVVALVALAFVPALTARPGQVVADTKLYLTLSPARLLSDSAWTWDARQFGGWVPHQNVGYLWPSGPFYWLGDALGLAPWLIQRCWIATILMAAGLGARWCARHLGLAPTAAFVAAVVYQLSPYVLPYISRTSVLLPPWAGLGWLVGLTVLAARLTGRRRWWPVAVFALVVVTVGGINATALLMIAPAPLLYLLDVVRRGEITWRRAGSTALALGAASAAVSVWWLSGLATQGRHGAAALAYSETLESTAFTSSAPEVLRGLGYWLFYVRDHVVALTTASTPYMERPVVIAAGWLLVLAGAAGLVFTTWQRRGFAAASVLVGVVLGVGAHPVGDPSPLWAPLAEHSRNTLVLALRSSTRAAPMVVLGLALGAGALCQALAARRTRAGHLAVTGLLLVGAVNLPALWTGAYADRALARDDVVSPAWREAADLLDDTGPGRVLMVPGIESAAFRWGYTVDPPLPGLSDKPLLTRDWLPLGSPGLMDLLYALDDRFQDGLAEPAALAPVARLLGADTVLTVNNLQFERFDTERPERAWAWFQAGVPGLGQPTFLGEEAPNTPVVPMVDDLVVARHDIGRPLPELAVYPVEDAVRAARTSASPVVFAGSGDGIVDAAGAGVLDGHELLIASAALDGALLDRALDQASEIIVTDSNRARARHWRGSQDVWGFTEDGGATRLLRDDPFDHRLPITGTDVPARQTLAFQQGAVTATATSYGTPLRHWPEYRPYRAIDGDLGSSWLVGDEADPRGETLQLTTDVQVERITLVQHQDPLADRWIGSVVVETDRGDRFTVTLDDRSRTPEGQPIDLPTPAVVISIEIQEVANAFPQVPWQGSAVGIAEVVTGLGPTEEVVRPPIDLTQRVTPGAPVTHVLTRLRADPTDRRRDDPEPTMVRQLALGPHRATDLDVTVRLSPRATDQVLGALLGGGRPVADRRAAGGVTTSGILATDADPGSAWVTPFAHAIGSTLYVPRSDVPIDRLTVWQPVRPGEVALVTGLRLTVGDQVREVAVAAPDERGRSVVRFDTLPPGTLAITVTATDGATTVDRRTGRDVLLPVAIAEVEGAGIRQQPLPGLIESGCRDDLLSVDGAPVALRLSATWEDVIGGRPMRTELCDAEAALTLLTGDVVVRTAPGRHTGLDVDRLVIRHGTAVPSPACALTERASRTTRSYTVASCPDGCWFVQGEGWSTGWSADVDGADLGPPVQLGAGMNGWWLDPHDAAVTVTARWTPQVVVWWAFACSGLAALAAVVVVVGAIRHRRAHGGALAPDTQPVAFVDLSPELTRRTVSYLAGSLAVVATGASVIGPVWGLAAGAVWLVAGLTRRPWATGAVGWALLALTGAYVVAHQVRFGALAGFGWPLEMGRVHRPALLGALLLAASAMRRAGSPDWTAH